MLNVRQFLLKASLIFLPLIFSNTSEISAKEYTIVLIPDSQNYTLDKKNIFHLKKQIKWIVNNRNKENIVLVSHVGDVIASNIGSYPYNLHLIGSLCSKRKVDFIKNQSDSWEKVSFISDLGNIEDLAFSISPGNHDYDCKNNKKSLKGFKKTFNNKKYLKRKWFLDIDEKAINTAQIFEINKQQFIHIGLEWQPSNKAIEFAQKIIKSNPEKPVILTTHEYLINRDKQFPERCKNSAIGCSWTSTKDNNGEELFQKLVKINPQIFMVLSGHNGVKEGYLVSQNLLDRKVIQITSDFSGDPGGGNGWMTLIRLNPEDSLITLKNFSPTYKKGITPGIDRSKEKIGHRVIKFDLKEFETFLRKKKVRHYRNGEIIKNNNYYFARDTNVYKNLFEKKIKNKIPFFKKNILVGNFFGENIGFLHFEEIIGNKNYQIPPNSKIEKAILTLTSNQVGFSSNFKIGANGILNFSNNILISPLDNNLKLKNNFNNIQNLKKFIDKNSSKRSTISGIVNSTQSFDVTSEIQEWVDGAENNGWLFYVPKGLWSFKSSNSKELIDRPKLTIVYENND